MEILTPLASDRKPVRAVLFDFDGTLSTLRCGWESIMAPLMIEILGDGCPDDGSTARTVAVYIDASTGIQTIFQMQWLAEQVQAQGRPAPDPWTYKDEYNRRLMQMVAQRRAAVEQDPRRADQYLLAGSRDLLSALAARGVDLYVASGTDQADVRQEAAVLGLAGFFRTIAGAPPHEASCSKARVIQELLGQNRLAGEELLVVGDGKVEIAIAREMGALALGVASDEVRRRGVNPAKRARLAAGAQAIVGDFTNQAEILAWLGIS